MRYFRLKPAGFLSAVLCLVLFFAQASAADDMIFSLRFSDGTVLTPETADQLPDVYWLQVPAGTDLNHVVLLISAKPGEYWTPQSGTAVSFPDAGFSLTQAAFVPVQCLDGQNRPVRTVRLYVSTKADLRTAAAAVSDEILDAGAKLNRETQILDRSGSPHALAGTLAAGTQVRVTGRRTAGQTVLYRIDLNGENTYLPQEALTFSEENAVPADMSGADAVEAMNRDGFYYAVTLYETGIRSGKGNNDKNLLGRAGKNVLMIVFSRVLDDDGKLLDLIFCPQMNLFGYVHDSQLKSLTEEEANAMFAPDAAPTDQGNEFQEAVFRKEAALYSYPDRNSAVLETAAAGESVFLYTQITAAEGAWYLAQKGDVLGYAAQEDILISLNPNAASAGPVTQRDNPALVSRYAAVSVSELLVYASPSLNAACIGRLPSGELMTIREEEISAEGMDWYHIGTADLDGYVLRDQTERLLIDSYLLTRTKREEE